jgi:hypothetical protein
MRGFFGAAIFSIVLFAFVGSAFAATGNIVGLVLVIDFPDDRAIHTLDEEFIGQVFSEIMEPMLIMSRLRERTPICLKI